MDFRRICKTLNKHGWHICRIRGTRYQFAHRDFGHVVTLSIHSFSNQASKNVLFYLKHQTGICFS